MSKEKITQQLINENIETGVKYHTPLPDDMTQWYVYTRNSGHRILCVPEMNLVPGMTQADYENQLVSAPVKTVLRGYTVQNGFVITNSLYDADKGFSTEQEDREFEEGIENPKFALTVGELYHPGKTSWPETVEYNYFSGTHELRFLLKTPSRYVTEVIRKMPVKLGLFAEGDVILLVYSFTDYKKQLIPIHGYSPFSIHMVPENMRTLPAPATSPEHEELLHIHLVDAETGILRAVRTVSLSPEFSAALCYAIIEQSKVPLSDDYNDRLQEIDKKYPDTEILMEHCSERCAG